MAAEAPRTEDLTLPGWGSWGGKAIPTRKNKIVRNISGIDRKARKDANLKHAIINEKKLKMVSNSSSSSSSKAINSSTVLTQSSFLAGKVSSKECSSWIRESASV